MEEPKTAHCLKCKSKSPLSDPVERKSVKNQSYYSGKCGGCGSTARTGNLKKPPVVEAKKPPAPKPNKKIVEKSYSSKK